MKNKVPSVVEVAGLPGSGKSTSCKILSEGKTLLSPRVFKWLNKLRCDILFLPLTIIYFNPILKLIYSKKNYNKKNYTEWLKFLTFQFLKNTKKPETIYINPSLDILYIFNRVMIMYFLAVIEGKFRKASIVMDDGFVQRGLSLWLRCNVKVQKEITEQYYKKITENIKCVVLDSGADEALRRVIQERGGLNTSLRFTNSQSTAPDFVNMQYAEMYQVLKKVAVEKKYYIATSEKNDSKECQAGKLNHQLNFILKGRKHFFWIC